MYIKKKLKVSKKKSLRSGKFVLDYAKPWDQLLQHSTWKLVRN